MATLLKDRARKPLVADGTAYQRLNYIDGQMMYGISITEPWQAGLKPQSYELLLTEEELFRIFGEHLADIARSRRLKRPTTPERP
ncbi:MAG: hypothetical protein WBF99_12630 [Xanthobacteraceae bacterium]